MGGRPQAARGSPQALAPSGEAAGDGRGLPGPRASGYITVGYRGTFAFGRDGLADVKFRKLSRILVCGRVQLCREVGPPIFLMRLIHRYVNWSIYCKKIKNAMNCFCLFFFCKYISRHR